MKFSVLMSVYNKENPSHFEKAIESIIRQNVVPTEIVIVKDGELTLELNKICDYYKSRYNDLFEFVSLDKNMGLGVALQIGVKQCKYDVIARMDTDDVAKPERFEIQLKELETNDELAIIGSSIEEFYGEISNVVSIRKTPLSHEEIIKYAKTRNPFNHMTVMFRKSAVIDVGNYQEFYLNEDYFLWYRLIKKGYKTKNLSQSLVLVRSNEKMFQRRGGMKYFLQELKLQAIFYNNGFINILELLTNVITRFIVRIVPNKLRAFIYKNYMRESV